MRQREVKELRASLDDISVCHGRLAFTSCEPWNWQARFAEEISTRTPALGSAQNREAG